MWVSSQYILNIRPQNENRMMAWLTAPEMEHSLGNYSPVSYYLVWKQQFLCAALQINPSVNCENIKPLYYNSCIDVSSEKELQQSQVVGFNCWLVTLPLVSCFLIGQCLVRWHNAVFWLVNGCLISWSDELFHHPSFWESNSCDSMMRVRHENDGSH